MFKDFKKPKLLDSYKKRWKYQKAKANYYKKEFERLQKPITEKIIENTRDTEIQKLLKKVDELEKQNKRLIFDNMELEMIVFDYEFQEDSRTLEQQYKGK